MTGTRSYDGASGNVSGLDGNTSPSRYYILRQRQSSTKTDRIPDYRIMNHGIAGCHRSVYGRWSSVIVDWVRKSRRDDQARRET